MVVRIGTEQGPQNTQITIIQSHIGFFSPSLSPFLCANEASEINNNVKVEEENLKNCEEHKVNSYLMSVRDHGGELNVVSQVCSLQVF